MAKVAIIGSCITRDLWPIRGDGNENLVYISRTSLPSLFSQRVPGFRSGLQPAALRRHQHAAVVGDLEKTGLRRLVQFAPTHIIFDFIDERFDLFTAGGSLGLYSWELVESGYLKHEALKGARRIPRLSAACERLWRDGADEFAALIGGTSLRSAKLILHVSRWASERQDAAGVRRPLTDVQILKDEPAEIGDHNALLARYEAYFQAVMPPMAKVDPTDFRIADEAHQWSLSPFHYIPEYYEEAWRQLEALGIQRPEARPVEGDAGSAPGPRSSVLAGAPSKRRAGGHFA